MDINDNNIKQNSQYYKRRQAICEHPFGTIKRHWGYTYTLMKGLEKVNGEMNLIMLCYNFMRTKSILGFDKMIAPSMFKAEDVRSGKKSVEEDEPIPLEDEAADEGALVH